MPTPGQSAPRPTLFVGGDIWTGTATPTDAVAIAAGRIVALGPDARALRDRTTQVIDLRGRTLLPGFRDGHLHPLEGGTESLDADLVDAVDVDEVLDRVARFAAAEPGLPWIVGYGYPPEILPGGVGRAELLDRVVGDRPVVLWSSDHHMAWCNTRALEIAGITAGTPDPPRGTVVRDAAGDPVGTLLEEADALVRVHLPPRGVEKEARGLRVGLERMARAGLVWGLDAWSVPERLVAYQGVADGGQLTADIDVAFKVEVDRWYEQLPAFSAAREQAAAGAARRRRDGVPCGQLSATTVKFFVDGVIEGGTGALLEPYLPLDGAGARDAGAHGAGSHGAGAHGAGAHGAGSHGGASHAGASRAAGDAQGGAGSQAGDGNGCGAAHGRDHGADHGIVNWEPRALAEAAAAADAAGFQLHFHAIGDAAVRLALDTFEAVAARNGPRDRRPTVAHTHLVHPDDLPRFAQLGAIANFEPLWAQSNEIMTELTEPRLGPKRGRWQYPIGSVMRTGAHVSFGSDWPVSSHEPLHGIPVAVTRQTPAGEPDGGWLPQERITLDQALSAYTAGTAYQAGEETEAGRIGVGQRADLVVVDAAVRQVPPRELAHAEVVGTWRGGHVVHATEEVGG